MENERQELRFAALLDALEQEHQRLREASQELVQIRGTLRQDIQAAAREAVQAALKALHEEIDQAGKVLVSLQGLSLWRAAWQHAIVAVVAIATTLLAVWWYVPSVPDMAAQRAQKAQLEAAITDLHERGARIVISHCGPKKRVCVAVDESAGRYWEAGETYRIAKGY
jgi:uncharacterized protein YhaN